MMRIHRKALVVLATCVSALAAAGCGAKGESNASTTAATPGPTLAAETPTPTPTPTATATPTPSPTPEPTEAPARAGAKLAVEADPTGQLKYTETTLTAKAGNTTIDFTNKAPVPHDVAIRKDGGKPIVTTDEISDDTTTADVKLAAGTYEFYCTVPGHEQAGMKGTLTVK